MSADTVPTIAVHSVKLLPRPTLATIDLSFFFSLIEHPPPATTLFPYTTLFRSCPPGRRSRSPADPRRAASSPACAPDRKSTRLNSSHVAISYAVFCLKKKTWQRRWLKGVSCLRWTLALWPTAPAIDQRLTP